MFKKSLLAASLMLSLAWAAPAAADTILFSPDGTGVVGAVEVNTIDMAPGNAIAIGVNGASPEGTDFTLYYQANLASFTLDGAFPAAFANGTDGNYFTIVAGFGETLVDSTFNPATGVGVLTFELDATNPVNFFTIYANDAQGNDLTGTCFVCGTAIMSGTIEEYISPSVFTSSGFAGALDAFGTNNYPAVGTVNGGGSVNILVSITDYSELYFPDISPDAVIAFALANTSTIIPYNQANPSACFLSTGGAPLCLGGFVGVGDVGTINGLNGNSTMLQADANGSFLVQQPIPEPATLTMLGLGLIGSAAARRRQKKAKK